MDVYHRYICGKLTEFFNKLGRNCSQFAKIFTRFRLNGRNTNFSTIAPIHWHSSDNYAEKPKQYYSGAHVTIDIILKQGDVSKTLLKIYDNQKS